MLPDLPRAPLALFLDVDGTLLDIAPRPEAVQVSDALRQTLSRLEARLGGALALVSGRAIGDLDNLFAPLKLNASGVHGAEMRIDAAQGITTAGELLLPDDVVEAVTAIAARDPGTLVENKRFSVAIHYRAVPQAEGRLRSALDNVIASSNGSGLRILPGHMVFEVKRSGFDKGTAVAAFLAQAPFAGRRPVFIGDDITDLPGFRRALDEGGLAYSVTTPRPAVSGHFADPAAVRTWLAALAASL